LRDIKNCKGIVGIWLELRDEAQRNSAVKIWQTFGLLSAQWHYMSVISKYQKSNWNELTDCQPDVWRNDLSNIENNFQFFGGCFGFF